LEVAELQNGDCTFWTSLYNGTTFGEMSSVLFLFIEGNL